MTKNKSFENFGANSITLPAKKISLWHKSRNITFYLEEKVPRKTYKDIAKKLDFKGNVFPAIYRPRAGFPIINPLPKKMVDDPDFCKVYLALLIIKDDVDADGKRQRPLWAIDQSPEEAILNFVNGIKVRY